MPDARVIAIRRSRAEDAVAILAIRHHPATRRYQPLDPGTLAEQRQALAERGSLPLEPDAEGKRQWIVTVDDCIAGWITLTITEREHHIASVGYSLAPEFHGQGIMPAALSQAIPLAFDPAGLALERLEALAAVANIASRRVLEKTGFRFEGISRGYLIIAGERVDHARYGLLRSDVKPEIRPDPR